jgi:type II secretory pathway component GspD/PulD (secretin)
MVVVSLRRHSLAGCLVLGAAMASVAFWSSGPAAEPDAKPSSAVAKVRKALDESMSLELTDQPLSAALNKIREHTKINFVVDRLTLQQNGIDPEQTHVSVKLKDVKARSCLRAVLSPYNLGYAIIGDTVLISTDEMVMHRQVQQRVNIDLERVSLPDALKQVARDTATSIILDPRVAKKDDVTGMQVTLQLDDVPLETAVRLMAAGAGLKPVQVGNVLFVTSKANAKEILTEEAANALVPSPPDYPLIKDKAK